jgi:heparosan-N-sulfate-glucuronate 5-epimerase
MPELNLKYPIDWSGLEDFAYDFDADGIPRVNYGHPIGLRYNAITTAQWGLFNLQKWADSGDESARAQALRCAEWLVYTCRPWKNDILAWIYDYGFDLYGPYPPWISGMAQGEAVSLLLRCHQLEHKNDFLRVSHGAARAFLYDYEEGGVTDRLNNGSIFFQEYPVEPSVHVLNGGIFAFFGVYDYAIFFNDAPMKDMARQFLDTLRRHWKKWDLGFWTRYDLFSVKRPASAMYQELHVRQFQALAEIFDDDLFLRVAERWRKQLKNPVARTLWAGAKLYEKLRLAAGRR